jgi:hypothetical protein
MIDEGKLSFDTGDESRRPSDETAFGLDPG